MDLNAVVPCFQHRIFGGGRVQLHVFFDLLDGQRAGCLVTFDRDGARPDDGVVTLFSKDVTFSGTPEGPELEKNERSVRVYCIRDLTGEIST